MSNKVDSPASASSSCGNAGEVLMGRKTSFVRSNSEKRRAAIALRSHNEGRSLKLGHRRLAIRHITELDAVLAHGVLQLR